MSDDDLKRGWEMHRDTAMVAAPSLYAVVYPDLVTVGREHGYAMAIHGSVTRDLDIVAVPWTEEASDAAQLLKALCDALGATPSKPSRKPHGRTSWVITLGGGPYIDLCVMPRTNGGPTDDT